MLKTKINTVNAPQAIGSYEQAIVVNDFVYTSGQIGLKPNGELVGECIKEQTTQCMQNLKAVLEAAGSNLDKVIKVTIFIKDMVEFKTIDNIYGAFFNNNFPARSCVEVARLPKDVRVEIEAIATL
ncbi:RidA family protein [Francisella adeliensis]|uniref:Reactive intermediate/imine deaminase n=1 Tax=Francisella adeliensis TaxID=2007306 RepID=A0A2Z4XXE8_9GAMM|nr:RidA family protein [Francisella adeliensis]AXA33561.1 reactive intermediate/imine deaminase [Francisella adeliensis]MBK2084733.1 RidA family protein [Francisella adeliensis]MBK2097324.1 RidA family protein [Francisella adeliensis]QIW11792.1 RidA family protein [Francisella adeliensis]QIW13668.1 RidA family protein [Francisella adeliensis]